MSTIVNIGQNRQIQSVFQGKHFKPEWQEIKYTFRFDLQMCTSAKQQGHSKNKKSEAFFSTL
jgi:hypothetical protein